LSSVSGHAADLDVRIRELQQLRGELRQLAEHGSRLAATWQSSVVASLRWQVTTRGNPGKELNSLWRAEMGEG
jgi:hypothetical protein